ncbi:WD40-repeat-containing domain protein [Lipomyces tetrasporus]|uniref:WD40-repeat-containing domain protein n=1 Tax=Lipomyces tetrasporus TaxID=54092 RepID=A0AAD7VQR6_9ASCO|nr:WD40-repeat-containing domain protein [Lipomyces tetrasporus]KAJ8097869.1 WD40-repeat-containing domain protein [Lipomyces tetrasporus]
MPSRDNVHVLVARYLRDNGYNNTLEAFKEELGLEDDMIPSDHSITLESIIEQKRLFDLSQELDAVTLVDDENDKWHVPYPGFKSVLPKQSPESNILSVSVAYLSMPISVDDSSSSVSTRPCIMATSADRSLRIFDFYTFDLLTVYTHLHSSPILTLLVLNESTLLTGGMDGRLVVSNPATGDVIAQLKDHMKYLVRIACSKDMRYLATAGYDKKVHAYSIENMGPDVPTIGFTRIGTLSFPTNPEAIVFVNPEEDNTTDSTPPQLVVSRRDSTFLYYYKLFPVLSEAARHNLNPDSNSWVSFCAMDIVLDPAESKFLGVATSTMPHMRFMLLESGADTIMKSAFTKAPQDTYSSARICWRPQGSGVWCNGDDGIIRGMELSTGNVVVELKHHEGKVKAMFAGIVDGREVLVTGGFDKTIALWELEKR